MMNEVAPPSLKPLKRIENKGKMTSSKKREWMLWGSPRTCEMYRKYF